MKPTRDQIFESGYVFVEENADVEGDHQNVPMSVHVPTQRGNYVPKTSTTNVPIKLVHDATRGVDVRGTVNGIDMFDIPSPTYQNIIVLRNRSVKSHKPDDFKKRKKLQVPPQDDTEIFRMCLESTG